MSSEKLLPTAAGILYTSLTDVRTAAACTATCQVTCSWYTQAISFTVDLGPGAALHISTAPRITGCACIPKTPWYTWQPSTWRPWRNAVLVRPPNSLSRRHPTGCSSTLPSLVHGAFGIAEPPLPAGVAAAPRTLPSLPSWLVLARLSRSEGCFFGAWGLPPACITQKRPNHGQVSVHGEPKFIEGQQPYIQ